MIDHLASPIAGIIDSPTDSRKSLLLLMFIVGASRDESFRCNPHKIESVDERLAKGSAGA